MLLVYFVMLLKTFTNMSKAYAKIFILLEDRRDQVNTMNILLITRRRKFPALDFLL